MLTLKSRILRNSSVFISFVLTAGLAFAAPNDLVGTIKIAGGTAHIPFIQEIAGKLSARYPSLKILVAGGGSGVGVQKLGAGLVDIANTGRPLSEEEKTRFDLVSYPLAYDAIVMVVHPENPIANLNLTDLQKIFTGEISTWERWTKKKEGASINLYVRDESSGTQEVFLERVLRKRKLARSANFTNSQGAMKLAISNDRNGIGFVSYGYLDKSVKALRLNGHPANPETIKAYSYPLVRLLYVNTKRQTSPLVKECIKNLKSLESAEIIRKFGLVPVSHSFKKSKKNL